jgi:hypothetical protein
MQPIHVVTLFLVVATPIAWACAEFQNRRWLRMTLGSLAISVCFGVAFLVASLDRFNSNAWFGFASKELVDATVSELEAGHQNRVLESLKHLQREFAPTYENRARYDVLVEEAVRHMRSTEIPASEPNVKAEPD